MNTYFDGDNNFHLTFVLNNKCHAREKSFFFGMSQDGKAMNES